MKVMQAKSTAKYESKIKELTMQCDLKAKECYEAWMSLTAKNEQLEAVPTWWMSKRTPEGSVWDMSLHKPT